METTRTPEPPRKAPREFTRVPLVRFLKVFAMLAWRCAVLDLFLLIFLPSLWQPPLPLLGVVFLAAALIVFGLRRTLRTFPIIRLFTGSHPLPNDAQLRAVDEVARERARQSTPEYQEELRQEDEQRAFADKRAQELDHAERIRNEKANLDT